jgi:hypothetical protein
MKTSIYYTILFSILLMTMGFVALFYQVYETRMTISRVTLVPFFLAMVGFLYVSLLRGYHIHTLFYLVSLVMIASTLLLA